MPSSRVSVTASSSVEEVALVTVTAVDVVATVGDGDGGRGGTTTSTGSTNSRSFMSSLVSGSGDEVEISGEDAGVDVGCGTAVDSAGGGGSEDPDDLESRRFSS